jgi:hypothetical protein
VNPRGKGKRRREQRCGERREGEREGDVVIGWQLRIPRTNNIQILKYMKLCFFVHLKRNTAIFLAPFSLRLEVEHQQRQPHRVVWGAGALLEFLHFVCQSNVL